MIKKAMEYMNIFERLKVISDLMWSITSSFIPFLHGSKREVIFLLLLGELEHNKLLNQNCNAS